MISVNPIEAHQDDGHIQRKRFTLSELRFTFDVSACFDVNNTKAQIVACNLVQIIISLLTSSVVK